jgi:hypothetical protein
MKRPLQIAVDLGAGSGRVFLGGVETGELTPRPSATWDCAAREYEAIEKRYLARLGRRVRRVSLFLRAFSHHIGHTLAICVHGTGELHVIVVGE